MILIVRLPTKLWNVVDIGMIPKGRFPYLNLFSSMSGTMVVHRSRLLR